MGWFRVESETWPELMELIPRPIPRAVAVADLRWLFYESPHRGRILSWAALAERWGWVAASGKLSKKKVRILIKSEDWRDTFQDTRGAVGAQQGRSEGAVRAQEGRSGNGQTSQVEQERAQEGRSEGAVRAQEGRSEGYTRVDPPSPSPSPSPSPPQEHTSGQASPAKPGRPPEGDRAYRRWAFHECMKFWHEMRQEQGKRKRTLDPNGKANTEGGSLWRMVGTTRESLEPLIRVLSYIRWAEDDQPGGATYYRSKGLALVNIRRHLAELDLKAQDYHDANGGWKPRSMQSRRREAEAYEEPTPERLDEIRAYFAARAAQ